jgi:solute carrier family 13 (sodium-dependent dicarboxylate transporter), member 2/3/5
MPWRGSITMSRRESPTVERSAGPRLGRLVIGLAVVSVAGFGARAAGLPAPAQITVVVFVSALLLWVGTRLDETLVALGAAVVLVLAGVLNDTAFFGTLAGSTIWLLIAAFVLATGVSGTGLTTRVATRLVARARSVRQLAHLVTAALAATAFAVPATSGRAALAVPVFVALARVLSDRPRVVHALAVLFPTVILLSAVATLIGAGAHLVTNQILAASTGVSVTFGQWLLLGVPLAVVSAHITAELVLALFTRPADRRVALRVPVAAIAEQVDTPVTGQLSAAQRRAALVLAAVMLAWCTASLHGMDPALVALAGALALSAPRVGVVTLAEALKGVPWSLLLFMAATAALAAALITSGAAGWLAGALFGPLDSGPPWLFLVVVVVASVAAHLVIQSRTARSSVLVPLVVPAAIALGLNPVAVAFASTAAAGFCHTLTSSAKPVAMFARIDDVTTYDAHDLLRLSAWLAPLTAALVLGCSLFVWPHLGLPLH